jgi:predicted esterase
MHGLSFRGRAAGSLIALAISLAAPARAATTVTVDEVTVAHGTIRIVTHRPDVPLANVVFLPGGNGVLDDPPSAEQAALFERLAAAGSSLVAVDAPSHAGLAGITRDYRMTPQHAEEIAAVLRAVQHRDNLPTWLLGFSNGGVAAVNAALGMPRTANFGLILLSPVTAGISNILDMDLESVRRPVLLLTHREDSCPSTPPANAVVVMARLARAIAKSHVEFDGGRETPLEPCAQRGRHGLGGLDEAFTQEIAAWERIQASHEQPPNYQGLWWGAPVGSDEGWGLGIAQQGNVLFATWFTHDAEGEPVWLVMSNGEPRSSALGDGLATYTGALYRTRHPQSPAAQLPREPVDVVAIGTATFVFTDSYNGVFSYSVDRLSHARPITRQLFAMPVPACIAAVPYTDPPNYQALWWAGPEESGWGLNIAHQGDVLFATLFTYGGDGDPRWLVMPRGERTGPATYSGDLFTTRGMDVEAASGIRPISRKIVGNMTLSFADAEHATLRYSIDGVAQSKSIVRQVYAHPATVCR